MYVNFSQQPLQFVPGIYHNPIDTHPVGSNFGAAPQIRVGSAQMPDNRGGTLPNIPGMFILFRGEGGPRGDFKLMKYGFWYMIILIPHIFYQRVS